MAADNFVVLSQNAKNDFMRLNSDDFVAFGLRESLVSQSICDFTSDFIRPILSAVVLEKRLNRFGSPRRAIVGDRSAISQSE